MFHSLCLETILSYFVKQFIGRNIIEPEMLIDEDAVAPPERCIKFVFITKKAAILVQRMVTSARDENSS